MDSIPYISSERFFVFAPSVIVATSWINSTTIENMQIKRSLRPPRSSEHRPLSNSDSLINYRTDPGPGVFPFIGFAVRGSHACSDPSPTCVRMPRTALYQNINQDPRWNYKSAYLALRCCRLPVTIYSSNEKILNGISGKLPRFFLSKWMIFCENFKWYEAGSFPLDAIKQERRFWTTRNDIRFFAVLSSW